MTVCRVRIRKPNGDTLVIDKTNSQLAEYLGDISSETFKKFLANREITAANGDAVLFVGYV